MRELVAIVWLLSLSVLGMAQPRLLQVRLFWQHPPATVHILPDHAFFRACATCPAKPFASPADITAQGSNVVYEGMSYSTFALNGRARITGADFSPFRIDGELRIESRDGFLLLTLSMPLERYVAAVLQGESAGFKSGEALKAMAVAARTYAVHFDSRHRSEGFDFCDTTHCQDVRLGNESARVTAAVAATEGELLWYAGRPAATYYNRSCGGETEDAAALEPGLQAPYLRQHHDDYCLRVPDEWQTQISKTDLSRSLGQPSDRVTVATRSDSGRVKTLLINGHPIGATDFRLAVGRALGWEKIRSDLYQMEDLGDRISFRGRGQGHGVGLCQTGADAMGAQGHTYREILDFYYPGTALGMNARGLSWERFPGESVDLISTHREDATVLLPLTEHALHFATIQTGWVLDIRPQIKVYPTIEIYRDATGEPGWVAASTLGNVIRLQPWATLRQTHTLDATLRHEFLHLLIESHAHPGAPLWLREGMAIYLSNPQSVKPAAADVDTLERRLNSSKTEEEMRSAYRDSASAVAHAVAKNGLSTVLSWLRTGK